MPTADARSRWYVAGVVALLLLGIAVRVPPITAGLPYINYVDENHVLEYSARMVAEPTWDPGWYEYPTLMATATAVTAGGWAMITGDDSISRGARLTHESPYYDIVEPTELIVSGRLVVLALSMGTLLVTILVGTRLRGRRVGLLAGLFAALLPALVSRSAIVSTDPATTFFVVATVLCATFIGPGRRGAAWAVAAGATAGLAAVSKYPGGAVILVPVIVIAVTAGLSIRRRVALACASAGAGLATAVLAMPSLLIHARGVRRDVLGTLDGYAAKATGTGYFEEIANSGEVGLLLVVPAIAGLMLLLRSPSSRPVSLGWLVFAVLVVGNASRFDYQPFRNLLPVLPFLAVAASVAIIALADGITRRLGRSQGTAAGLAGGMSLAICLVMVTQGVAPFLDKQADLVNTRVLAVDWVTENVDTDETVLVAAELAFLPSELDRIDAEVVVVSITEEVDLAQADYLITGRFDAPISGWAAPAGDPLKAFSNSWVPVPTGLWRGNRPGVQIYEVDTD